MPFEELILSLLNFRKGTVPAELSQFATALHGPEALPSVTPSAFCQARLKLRPEALVSLNERLIEQFRQRCTQRRWHGFRLLAVDGSKARLPNQPVVKAAFGGPKDSPVPLGRFSRLFDVLNQVVLAADLVPYNEAERDVAAAYLYKTVPDDLLLYDRGYAAFWLFSMHHELNRNYCARLKIGFSNQIKAFVSSGRRSQVIMMSPGDKAKAHCREYEVSPDPIKVRLIRVDLGKGKYEILATSLLDEAAYPTTWFKKLYHARWSIEEHYKREKLRLEIENFSGRSLTVIRQDVDAKIIAMNLTGILVWLAQNIAQRVHRDRTHDYKINFSHTLSIMKNHWIRYAYHHRPIQALLRFLTQMVESAEAIRPDRSYPRIKRKPRGRVFYPNYKRTT